MPRVNRLPRITQNSVSGNELVFITDDNGASVNISIQELFAHFHGISVEGVDQVEYAGFVPDGTTISQLQDGTVTPTAGTAGTAGQLDAYRFVYTPSGGAAVTTYLLINNGADGQQGDRGEAGPQGMPGPMGDTGAQGDSVTGLTIVSGGTTPGDETIVQFTGPNGNIGPQVTFQPGLRGATGDRGVQGGA